ncbi:MAG: alanine dehydrogenase [Candidatus Diapherotrites archaeon]
MIVGVLKEIKDNENRVAITPNGVQEFVSKGHELLVEKDAGIGSGFSNEEYEKAGAILIGTPKELCEKAELVMKIKEPIKEEHTYFRKDQVLFTYFHFASMRELTDNMISSNAACVAYETVELEDRSLPLLAPMSEVAGKMSIHIGAHYLAKFAGGKGILLAGVTNVKPGNVVIIGGGVVGESAAKVALGMGANTTVIELRDERIEELKKLYPKLNLVKSNPENIANEVPKADLLVGGVLVAGAEAPKLVSRENVAKMAPGSVIVDVAIDQGGCIETSRPTSHSDPVYVEEGVTHYCVTNMPGAFPRTSTFAITAATLPYAIEMADKGWKTALKENPALMKGLNMIDGKVTYKGVADAFGMEYVEPEKALG